MPLQLIMIVVISFVIGLVYLMATPPLDASDELWHMGMVQHIQEKQQLPVQNPTEPDPLFLQQASQPPLYYALVALLTAGVDYSADDLLSLRNPHAKLGLPGIPDNKSITLWDQHPPAPQGLALAVYMGQLFSLCLHSMTIIGVYHIARRLAPEAGRDSLPLIAAMLVAFNPMSLFIAASVNNDNLVTTLNTLVIILLLSVVLDGFTTRRSIMLSVLLALATLTKLSGLVLVPVCVLAAFYRLWRDRDIRDFIILGVCMAGFWGVLAGWWYARNIALYHELFGTSTMVAVAGARPEPFTLATLVQEFGGFRISFWGLFGAVNITTTALFYWLMDIVTALSLVGLAAFAIRQRHKLSRDVIIGWSALSLIVVIGMASFISWTAQTYASQGRLLFPFYGAIAPLMALGLWWIAGRYQRIWWLGGAMLAIFALAAPFIWIIPTYTRPAPLASVPPDAQTANIRFGDVVELAAYEIEKRHYAPGDAVPVTLYWRPLRQTEVDYSLFIHAISGQSRMIDQLDSYPGGGRLRTSTWEVGGIYQDTYFIPLDDLPAASIETLANEPLFLRIGWWQLKTEQQLALYNDDTEIQKPYRIHVGGISGQQVPPTIPTLPQSARPLAIRYADLVELVGYEIDDRRYVAGDVLPVTLYWRPLRFAETDYYLTLGAIDDYGEVLGRHASTPGNGRLSTRAWQQDIIYADTYEILLDETGDAASSRIDLEINWRQPETEAYLSIMADGQVVPALLLDAGAYYNPDTYLDIPLTPVSSTGQDDTIFGQVFQLTGYQYTEDAIYLEWETIAPPDENYVVFVHVVTESGDLIAQADKPPRLPTQYRQINETFVTLHPLSAADRRGGSVVVGWYQPETFARLPNNTTNNALLLPDS